MLYINLKNFPSDEEASSSLGPFTVSSSTQKVDTRARARAVNLKIENTTTNEFEGYFGSTPAWGAIGGGGGTVTEAFKTIAVSGQSDIVADSATDTLNIAAGSNINLTTNAATDTLTIESTGGGGGTVTVERNNYTGDGTTLTFAVTTYGGGIKHSDDSLLVFLNGVAQIAGQNYTVDANGANVVFSSGDAPLSTDTIHILELPI